MLKEDRNLFPSCSIVLGGGIGFVLHLFPGTQTNVMALSSSTGSFYLCVQYSYFSYWQFLTSDKGQKETGWAVCPYRVTQRSYMLSATTDCRGGLEFNSVGRLWPVETWRFLLLRGRKGKWTSWNEVLPHITSFVIPFCRWRNWWNSLTPISGRAGIYPRLWRGSQDCGLHHHAVLPTLNALICRLLKEKLPHHTHTQSMSYP